MRLVLAMALVLALAAPASAQSPIAGGGSFNDAPVLAPGKYKDTLRGGEQLFYAVTLKPGQQLTAGATVSGRTESSYFMRMSIYSPLREKDVFKGTQTDSYASSDKSVSLRVEGQRVGEKGGGNSDTVYSEPGTFYVSVAADDQGRNLEADQFDTLIDLQVTGNVIPTPTPTATAKPAATVESGQTAGLGGGDGGGGSGELGMTIVLALDARRAGGLRRQAAAGVALARAARKPPSAPIRAPNTSTMPNTLSPWAWPNSVSWSRPLTIASAIAHTGPTSAPQAAPRAGEAAARSRATTKPA